MLAATAFAATALTSGSAQAAPCSVDSSGKLNCSKGNGGSGSTGGGGGTGGEGPSAGMPSAPLDPEDLTDNEAVGVVPIDGDGPVPQAPPPATIDLAEQARASAQLPTPKVHTAPNGKTFVRVRTSLWVDGFVTVQTDPITVGAQTVQATATPKSVTWNLGDTTLTCDDAGSKDGGSCSHTYERSSAKAPGGAYKITATINWTVQWTCVGAECAPDGGTLPDLVMISVPTPLVVGEIQTNSRG